MTPAERHSGAEQLRLFEEARKQAQKKASSRYLLTPQDPSTTQAKQAAVLCFIIAQRKPTRKR